MKSNGVSVQTNSQTPKQCGNTLKSTLVMKPLVERLHSLG